MVIKTYDQVVTVLTIMKSQIVNYQTEVGATAADIAFIIDTLANLTGIQDYGDQVDAAKKAVFQIKQQSFNGDPGETVSDMPVFSAFVIPAPPIVSGALPLLLQMIRRFKLGPGYTHEIGVALGFESSDPSAPTNPASVVPTVEVTPAQIGAMFSAVVSNRADSDMWQVQILRSGGDTWETVGAFSGKSADVTITLTTAGKPEQIQVRIQLRKNNANYGQLSAAVTVTVNP